MYTIAESAYAVMGYIVAVVCVAVVYKLWWSYMRGAYTVVGVTDALHGGVNNDGRQDVVIAHTAGW